MSTMNRHTQQVFDWARQTPEAPSNAEVPAQPPEPTPEQPPTPQPLETLHAPEVWDTPMAQPLSEAVAAGLFGMTTEGPIEPDAEEVRAMIEEHGRELVTLLADIQAVEDAKRTGQDPRTGARPKTTEAETKLQEFLEREAPRLSAAYAAALDAYARGFGDAAAKALDLWARKTVADCTIEPKDRYDPGHPWHYLPEGDNARPIPVEEIEPDIDVGRYIEQELPKKPAKRREKLHAMLAQERERVEQDKRRYQEIVEKGAEALSRYDREIAHTSDDMARATAISLKYNHLRYGLGRVAWIERQLGLQSSADTPVWPREVGSFHEQDDLA